MNDTIKFLDAIRSNVTDEHLTEIRTIDPANQGPGAAKSTFFCPGSAQSMAAHCLRQAEAGRNVYVGVLPRSRHSGRADAIHSVNALWIELDRKVSDAADHLEAYESSPIPPSIVVDSGGGWHLYWILEAPIPTADFETMVRPVLIAMTPENGDALDDSPRILRVPGTLNYKYDPPRPVMIVRCDPQRRYTLDAIRDVVGETPVPVSKSFAIYAGGAYYMRDLFEAAGLLGREVAPNKFAVTCPWSEHHWAGAERRGSDTETTTILWPPSGEDTLGNVHCGHAGCIKRKREAGSMSAFLRLLHEKLGEVALARAEAQQRRRILRTVFGGGRR